MSLHVIPEQPISRFQRDSFRAAGPLLGLIRRPMGSTQDLIIREQLQSDRLFAEIRLLNLGASG